MNSFVDIGVWNGVTITTAAGVYRPTEKKVIGLIAFLVTSQRVSRMACQQRLWDEPPPSAQANLNTYLSKVRAGLGPAVDRLITERTTGVVHLDLDPGESDVGRHRAAVARADEALWQNHALSAAGNYLAAISHWAGDDVAGLPKSKGMAALAMTWRLTHARAAIRFGEIAPAAQFADQAEPHVAKALEEFPELATVAVLRNYPRLATDEMLKRFPELKQELAAAGG